MLSAQARGHEVFHYDVGDLTLDADDRLIAHGAPGAGAARSRAIISASVSRSGSTSGATSTWC